MTDAIAAVEYQKLARRAIIRSVKQEATALLERGPCYRQAKLAPLVGVVESYLPPTSRIVSQIRAEARRVAAGHWAGDVNRLIALRGHLLARRFERRMEAR